jgi:hypothetical protein
MFLVVESDGEWLKAFEIDLPYKTTYVFDI